MNIMARHFPISRSDTILGGTAVFAGTRVPIQALIDYLEAGDDINQFLDDFPTVTKKQVVAVLEQARKHLLAKNNNHHARVA
jgi:uncharacterized protein (DUF433 family)